MAVVVAVVTFIVAYQLALLVGAGIVADVAVVVAGTSVIVPLMTVEVAGVAVTACSHCCDSCHCCGP